jgi:HlyD family secretion protein
MKITSHILWILFISIAILFTLGFRRYSSKAENTALFTTEKAQQRNIVSAIKTKGTLIPVEIVRVGNIVNGIIRYLYFQENDLVNKGQLLAEIDDGREDWDINANFGNLDTNQAVLSYQYEFLKRQEQLFIRKQISLDTFQQAQRDYQAAYAKVEQAKGLYEQSKLTYDNKKVFSKVSGMIIEKDVSLGETISNDTGVAPVTIICKIAREIELLKAYILLDDAALESTTTNMTATMTVDTYPHKKFIGNISEIISIYHTMEIADYPYLSLIPKVEKSASHYAIAAIDNKDLTLRPGMTFTASITIAAKENVLSLPSQVFKISKHSIQQIAEDRGYKYQPLDNRKLLELAHADNAKTVWVYKNNTFIEKAITAGISNADYVEITQGIDENDDIVYEAHEPTAIATEPSKVSNPSA